MNPESLRTNLLPLRQQADLRNTWLRERLDTLLPELMAREGFDAWIVARGEYNEDPVIMTLLPEPAMAARRRAILLFARHDDGSVERLTLDRYGYSDFYERGWDPDTAERRNRCLRDLRVRRLPDPYRARAARRGARRRADGPHPQRRTPRSRLARAAGGRRGRALPRAGPP